MLEDFKNINLYYILYFFSFIYISNLPSYLYHKLSKKIANLNNDLNLEEFYLFYQLFFFAKVSNNYRVYTN